VVRAALEELERDLRGGDRDHALSLIGAQVRREATPPGATRAFRNLTAVQSPDNLCPIPRSDTARMTGAFPPT
jgi:hypothetical protein